MLAMNTDHKLREGQRLGGQRLPRIMNKQDITKYKDMVNYTKLFSIWKIY